ncbi:hypothetical protein [Methanopyrus kandleri]|uniref:Uncharacterized protein n=1 Tax=Methanopyrus kandleri TaxID=2320 RepID=A0A832WJW9_9EURY|nr:hypothetical protein [Methanopyrus kandleri]HII69605.1 hypothetical protein [Methanopyrus kandleri]
MKAYTAPLGEVLRDLDPKIARRLERFLEDLTERLREELSEAEYDRVLTRLVQADFDVELVLKTLDREKGVRKELRELRDEIEQLRSELKEARSKLSSETEELESKVKDLEERYEKLLESYVQEASSALRKALRLNTQSILEEILRDRLVKGT